MLNPYVCKIEGDLSRADVVVLTLLCRGKKVIEFGIGGSTILLSQIADKVITYEHDDFWIDKIKPKLGANVEIRKLEKNPEAIKGLGEECDVLFNDGWSLFRSPALLEFWPFIKECAILHDGRTNYAHNCVKALLDVWDKNEKSEANPGLPDNPYTGTLKKIDWNWLESNMVVLHKRNCQLKYENWKITEI